MVSTPLHWIPDLPKGRLAISARPRGGDWLSDELFAWKAEGVDVIVSLLEPDEAASLDLTNERQAAKVVQLDFISFPIPDLSIPSPHVALRRLDQLKKELAANRTILIHCRQGVGRAGMITSLLLAKATGISAVEAIDIVSNARAIPVPETAEQRAFIARILES